MIKHVSMLIETVLRNVTSQQLEHLFVDDGGAQMSAPDVMSELHRMHLRGERFIKSTACGNFDPRRGCLCKEKSV